MSVTAMFYAYVASNVIALLMLLASWRRRDFGRLLFVLLFLWAGQWNLRTSILHPQDYLGYAELTSLDVYRRIILGVFARHVTPIVFAIAVGQLASAALVSLRGRMVRLGLIGEIAFLVAIAPFGIGSAFPATLIMAAAAVVLLRTRYDHTLWSMARLHRPVRVRAAELRLGRVA